ncbi:hypothetical protein JXO59_09210 [candidate division KSB1 bacterium]|nr:hypothetical protein [candidate division KSB1 bacterium]
MRKVLLFLWIGAISVQMTAAADFDPKTDGWDFYNFLMTTDNTVLWGIYSKSFLGIANTYAAASVEDQLFFDLVISRYAGHANCFGMSNLAIICYKEGGHLSACSPVCTYEGDLSPTHAGPDLNMIRESIGIMHLRQLTQKMISLLIERFTDSKWDKPNEAFGQIKTEIATNGASLVSFMPASVAAAEAAMSGGQEAHTVVAYKVEESPGAWYKIYVYDPNRPYSTESAFYDGTGKINFIYVNQASATLDWHYPDDYPPGTNSYGWEGSSAGPWTFIPSTSYDARFKDDHPLDAGYITSQLGQIFLSGDGEVTQIEDETGRRFYKQSASGLQFEKDPNKRMLNMIRWPFFHAGKGEKLPEVYFMQNPQGKSFKIQIASKSGKYDCRLLQKGNFIKMEAGGSGAGRDTLQIAAFATEEQTLTIGSQRNLANVRVELFKRLADQTTRTFILSDVTVTKSAPVQMQCVDYFSSLAVSSPRAEVRYKLEMAQKIGDRVERSPVQSFTVPAGKRQLLRPLDWENLKDSAIDKVEREVLKKVQPR